MKIDTDALVLFGLVGVALGLAGPLRAQDEGSSRRTVQLPTPATDGRECEAWPQDGFELRVVHAETQLPVPHALIRFAEYRDSGYSERSWYTGTWQSEALHSGPERWFRANEQGRVVVPKILAWVEGSSAGLWGRGWVAADLEHTRTLALHPDTSVAVRVTDGEGNPLLHLPVELLLTGRERTEGFADLPGPDGLVRFAHLSYQAAIAGTQRVAVSLPLALAAPVEVKLDPRALPDAPVVLVAPPLGELEIRLTDERGAPLSAAARVLMWPAETQPDFERESLRAPPLPGSRVRHAQAGEGRLREPVGLGLELEVLVSADGGFGAVHQLVRGPARAGEVVACTLRLVPERPALGGRLVNESGQPLANSSFRLHLLDRRGQPTISPAGARLRSDAEGRFHTNLLCAMDVAVVHIRSESGQLSVPVDVTVMREAPLKLGENELGILVLAALPELVSGRVVDEGGQPLADVSVFVSKQQPTGWGSRGESWVPDHDLRCVTDAQGRFSIHTRTAADSLELSAHQGSFVTEQGVRVRPPSRDVVLVMGRDGEIAGSLRADEHVPSRSFRVEAVAEAGDPRVVYRATMEQANEYHIRGLPAGRYRLSVRHPLVDPELVSFSGLHVRSGETCLEPGLAEVDLRSLVGTLALTVQDEEGRALADASAIYRQAGATFGAVQSAVRASPGRLVVANGGRPVDVFVRAPGQRERILPQVTRATTVVLGKGIPLRFLFAGTDGSSARELGAQVSLLQLDPGAWPGLLTTPFGESGEAEVRVERPGTYDVLLYWTRPRVEQQVFTCGNGPRVKSPSIEVREQTEAQVFRIQLSSGGEVCVVPQ